MSIRREKVEQTPRTARRSCSLSTFLTMKAATSELDNLSFLDGYRVELIELG